MKYYFEKSDRYDGCDHIEELTDYELKRAVTSSSFHKPSLRLYIEVEMPKEISDKVDALIAGKKIAEDIANKEFELKKVETAYRTIKEYEAKKNL